MLFDFIEVFILLVSTNSVLHPRVQKNIRQILDEITRKISSNFEQTFELEEKLASLFDLL